MKKTICLLIALWLGLSVFAWLKPAEESSDSERRNLGQFPEFSVKNLISGEFMGDFGDYATDQFPLRDSWRRVNAYWSRYVLAQKDSDGIYLYDGHAAKMEYPLDEKALSYAADRFDELYGMYLADSDCRVRFAVVPDKSRYLAEEAGVLALDYEELNQKLENRLDWAEFVDLSSCLSADSYYRTDPHWRQETLLPVVEALGLNVSGEVAKQEATDEFYGVYCGQAALPMAPDDQDYLTFDGWEDVTVWSLDTGKTAGLYDFSKVESKDPYEFFLSGNMALQVIENPHAKTDRELILFRDSFGSSLAPLLSRYYAKVPLIDTRYMAPSMIGDYVNFEDQDVLFLYSTLVLNSSSALRKG